jgi:hypothetical protein
VPIPTPTREELTSLIEGRLSAASAKDELVKWRLIIEEGLEGEAGDVVGRDYYEHGAQAGQGYRNDRSAAGRRRENLTPSLLQKGHSKAFVAKCVLIALPRPQSTELIWGHMGKGDCDGKARRHQRGVQTARSLFPVR